MKKIIVLFLSLILISVKMEAKMKPYVQWTTAVPAAPQMQWLDPLINGGTITGAIINSNSSAYATPLGYTLFVKVSAALKAGEYSRFTTGLSKGGEINYGINAEGKSEATGTLPAGVLIIYFDGIPIAKWGTNGCLNALSLSVPVFTGDPDELAFNKPNGQASPVNNNPAGSNTNTTNVYGGNSGADLLATYRNGLGDGASLLERGMQAANSIQDRTTLNNIALINSSGNTGGGQQQQSLGYATQMPGIQTIPANMGYANSGYNNGQYQGVSYSEVKVKANTNDWVNTGLMAVGVGLNAVNTFRGIRFEQQPTISVFNNGRSGGGGGGGNNTVFIPNHQSTF